MTSPSRRKHPITRLNLRPWKNIDGCRWARWLTGPAVASAALVLSLGNLSAADLSWGRTASAQPQPPTAAGQSLQQTDEARMAAAWDADDALAAEAADMDSLAEQQQGDADFLQTVDPFEADDRLAQLTKDPFEEPLEGPIPQLNQDLDQIENALEEEMQRREDSFDETFEEEASTPRDEPTPREEEEPLVDEPMFTNELDFSEDGFEEPSERDESSQIRERETPKSEFNFDLKVPPREPVETPRTNLFRDNRQETDLSVENQKNCEEELAAAKSDRISSVDLNIQLEGIAGEDYPYECTFGDEAHEGRSWPEITYTWKASALCHKPLYFEQAQLERYGHDWGPYMQPLMSGAHFFGTLPILPYKMGIESPCECIYALGHYRPGSCAPYNIGGFPFTWRAAAYQAGFVTGLSFVIP